MTKGEYVEYLVSLGGGRCDFLTVVELAPRYLGYDLDNEEAIKIHDTVNRNGRKERHEVR